jgi:hypothetical protein
MRWGTHLIRWGLVAVCVLVTASTASADGERTISLAYYIADDGTGMLTANLSPDRWAAPRWERCLPDGSPCQPISPELDGTLVHTGDAPAGTVFRATASADGITMVATSDPYRGQLTRITPPRVQGALRVGSLVAPVGASWSGAWGGEQPFLQLQVCGDASGTNCRVISSTEYWERCPGVGAVLRPDDQGRYLRVADQRYARIPIFAQRGVTDPRGLPPLKAVGNVAVTTVGRIGPATGPAQSDCGGTRKYAWPPRRRVHIERRVARIGSRVLARVSCTFVCSVRATLEQGTQVLRMSRQVRPGGSGALVLSATEARRLIRGRARLTVLVDRKSRVTRPIEVA